MTQKGGHNMRKFYYLTLLLLCSCVKDLEMIPEIQNENQSDQLTNCIEVIPVEEALQTLDKFLSENDMIQTKSGYTRSYDQVSTYFRKGILTKSGSDENLPTAYVVNFENDEGFAVLGANNVVPDVIAVTESGSINPKFRRKQNFFA